MRREAGESGVVRRLDGGPSVEAAVCRFAAERGAVCLESTASGHRDGRFSVLGCEPVDEVRFDGVVDGGWLDGLREKIGPASLKTWDTRGLGERREHSRHPQGVALQKSVESTPPPLKAVGHPGKINQSPTSEDMGHPRGPQWMGYVGYEAGAALEGVGSRHGRGLGVPDVWFGCYPAVAVFDHVEQVWTVSGDEAGVDRLVGLLADAREPGVIDWDVPVAEELVGDLSRAAYVERVEKAQAHIAAGDIYQVNLTQRFSAACVADGLTVYRRLRRTNGGAMSAFLKVGDACICSSSPEVLLRLADGRVETRPIKGTKPRTGDAVLDAANRASLETSEKDLAELTMIVDLLRNDLGRVAAWGSVRVDALAEIEEHPTVFHLVSTISARMRAGLDWSDLLRATLPGGSITGCPKIRAMQIIDELEVGRRDVYCGGIGMIGGDGSLVMNVAIRTMVVEAGRVHVYGGGAITADSDADDEWAEVEAKIAGMVRALKGDSVRVEEERTA